MNFQRIERSNTDNLEFLRKKEGEISSRGLEIVEKKSLNDLELDHIFTVTKRNDNLEHHSTEHFQEISKNGVAIMYRGSEIVASILANNYDFRGQSIYEKRDILNDEIILYEMEN